MWLWPCLVCRCTGQARVARLATRRGLRVGPAQRNRPDPGDASALSAPRQSPQVLHSHSRHSCMWNLFSGDWHECESELEHRTSGCQWTARHALALARAVVSAIKIQVPLRQASREPGSEYRDHESKSSRLPHRMCRRSLRSGAPCRPMWELLISHVIIESSP